MGFLSSIQKACALPKLDDNIPVSIPKSSAKPFSILSGSDNNMDIHTLKEQFWQIKRQILDSYDDYVVTYTRNRAHGLFSSMHISLLPEPDILFICKVEEVTEQLMETTARQFENLKKENDHQLWFKEQYATLCASPKTSIEQIVPSIYDSQKTAPVINISASSSDSLSACSSPVKMPVQLTESLTSPRDLRPLDSKNGSESSEGSVSAPLSEQIKPKEEESSDADSNSCTLRNQDMTLLEINGKLCNSVEESESSDDSGSCLAVNKPADSAVQIAHTPEFSDCGDTPALSNNIIEFSDNKETVPVSSELMDFSDHEEIPAITKNVMDFLESLKISSVSKQTVENSDKEESQQSETEQPVIRNESLLLELDTVAASTTDPDLLIPANVYPVSSSTISEDKISELLVSDLDVKPATPMSPAVSLKLKTPENQQSETEVQVLKDVIFPAKTKDLNLDLVFEDLMISTVLSVLLQETIINSKARAENLDTNVKAISEETPVPFLSKEQPFSVNRVEDQLPVVETLCKETISDTMNTPQSTCNDEISVLSEDHPKELACGTSTFSDVNPVSKDLKTLVAPEFDTPKSSKMKDNSDFFMFTLRTPVTHVSQVSLLCKPQTTINVNTAAETDKSCLSECVTDLTVTNTPIISSKEESIEQETNVIKNTAHDAIPDLLAPESTSPETNSMHSSHITRTIKRKDIRAHMGINTCFAHGMIHLWQDCKLINQGHGQPIAWLAGRVSSVLRRPYGILQGSWVPDSSTPPKKARSSALLTAVGFCLLFAAVEAPGRLECGVRPRSDGRDQRWCGGTIKAFSSGCGCWPVPDRAAGVRGGGVLWGCHPTAPEVRKADDWSRCWCFDQLALQRHYEEEEVGACSPTLWIACQHITSPMCGGSDLHGDSEVKGQEWRWYMAQSELLRSGLGWCTALQSSLVGDGKGHGSGTRQVVTLQR
ncbi:hypothetical protein NDU88_006905 [Pleurodeles waltl]|uniref:Uncharacterized protein n=1 Tax=Pleurodeles waltl TaxID=8319 RepID=A0AAV7VRZ6_PLEWA|nr:hypothetical protein NDU88_006905 [Pleurodeles waltl]